MKKVIIQVGQTILEMIKDMGELAADIALTPYGQFRYHNRPSFATYYRSLKKLQSEGLIKKKRKAYKNYFILTAKGKGLLNKPRKIMPRSDGFSTMIIFDIPEEKSKERQIFRRHLLRNGYTLIQKSVLISRGKIIDEVRDLIKELKIDQYISTFDVKMTFKI